MSTGFSIADRPIGRGQPCFIIAEAGVNHNGDIEMALQLVDVAAEARADAVKFQTFSASRLATREAPKAAYQLNATNRDESQYEMLKRLELSFDDHRILLQRCRERGILFLSTPFDEQAADLLETLDVVAYKTPSGELTNLPYLQHVARKGKPMIVSTGMATLAEVDEAVTAVHEAGASIALLHCVSNYPAEPSSVNLRAMSTMEDAFGVPVGFSDHTTGLSIALASIALGASVLEKHYTLDRRLPGPDHAASLEPQELSQLVRGIRDVEGSLGDGRKTPVPAEMATAIAARKSLVLARNVPAGHVLTDEDIAAKRPGTGLPLKHRSDVLGRTTRRELSADTVLTWEMLV